jgi:hypothetical protein
MPVLAASPGTGNFGWSNSFSTYEALSTSGDRTPITAIGLGPMLSPGRWFPTPTVNFQRLRLSALSRYLADNNGLVSYGLDLVGNYSVPVIPNAATGDPAINAAYEAYFGEISKRADYSGRFNFAELQRLCCRMIDVDGDVGYIVTNENGFPQIQTIEGWRIGSLKQATNNRICDGVVLSNKGVVIGYVVQNEGGETIVSADQMKLLYDPDLYHAYRGISCIRRGANDIRDHNDIKAFEKTSTKIASLLAAVIEGGPLQEDDWGNDAGNEDHPTQGVNTDGTLADGTEATKADKKIGMADLMDGNIPVLPDGQVFKLLENRRGTAAVGDFLGLLAGFFIAGQGLPPAFFLDEKLTGPNIRAVMGKAQKKFDKRAEKVGGLAEWFWKIVIQDGIQKKDIPPSKNWASVNLQRPSRLTIDLGDQSSNDREDVANGQMTRQERFGNRALDWQSQTDQMDAEHNYIIAKAKATAAKHGIPIDILLAAYGLGNQKPVAQVNKEQAQQQQKQGA